MPKFNGVKLVKILGLLLTIGGTIATSWAGDKENLETLEKLANERFDNK